MAEATIEPPVLTVNQSDSPEQMAATMKSVQEAFDRVAPKIKTAPTPPVTEPSQPVTPDRTKLTEQSVQAPEKPVDASETKERPPESAPDKVAKEHVLPSFLEETLKVPEVKSTESPVTEDEWPEELPTFKSSEEAKQQYKTWRKEYKRLKETSKAPVADPALDQKVQYLENQNKEMQATLQRMGVETHREFQTKIIAPMNAAYQEAARIVQVTGGDPKQLARALSLTGKDHFEALDEIFSGMPESAKIEANNAVVEYRRADEARKRALADAPKTAQALKKADLERQYAQVQEQRKAMEGLWEAAGRQLRDQAKVEVMQRSNNPEDKWWNDQIDADEETSRRLFLDNTDMEKVAMAMRLAPLVDRYRKLWLTERQARMKSDGIIKEKFGSEPNLSESGGNSRNGISSQEEDLKKPLTEVFLREYHKQRASGVR